MRCFRSCFRNILIALVASPLYVKTYGFVLVDVNGTEEIEDFSSSLSSSSSA